MSTHFPGDESPDALAARLRDALSSEAAMVTPSDDGLQQIRDGIAGAGRPWWQHPGVLAVAAAVVLGVAVGAGIAFLGGDDDEGTENVATGPSSGSATGSGSESAEPSDSPTPESSTAVPVEGDVYVYYAMDDGKAPRLYREERPNPGSSPVTAALTTLLTEPANDPDYSSPWPTGTRLLSYSVQGSTDGGVGVVDVSRFPKVGSASEEIAVQQVVYTVTANDKSVKRVRLLVNGKPPTSGHEDLSEPVARAPMLEVQGLVWLLSPKQGETVSSPVTISGYGTAYEATISWEVDSYGEKVAEGTTQAGANGEFGEFTDTVELDPGTYEVKAFESSAEDGSPQNVDSKTFTVE
jgi:hypothetical protein